MSKAVKVDSEEQFWKDGFEPLTIDVTVDRLRLLGKVYRKDEFTTEEAKAFLLLHRKGLEAAANEAIRQYIKGKL